MEIEEHIDTIERYFTGRRALFRDCKAACEALRNVPQYETIAERLYRLAADNSDPSPFRINKALTELRAVTQARKAA